MRLFTLFLIYFDKTALAYPLAKSLIFLLLKKRDKLLSKFSTKIGKLLASLLMVESEWVTERLIASDFSFNF